MVRKTVHGIETCQDCMDIWIFVREAKSIRFNALLKLCQKRIDSKYSAPRLQRHLEGMVGRFLKRREEGSQKVLYSLINPRRFGTKPMNVDVLVEGRKARLDEIIQLLIDHSELELYSELELILKKFLKEGTPAEERLAITRAQGRLLVAFCKDAMAGRTESEYREALKILKGKSDRYKKNLSGPFFEPPKDKSKKINDKLQSESSAF
jgi:hypothetical protein